MSAIDRAQRLVEARRWWAVAADDLWVARACLSMDPPSPGIAAYHCQQTAEKTMEGLLVAAGVGFRKIHDLDELASIAAPLYPALAADLDRCRPFTSWATEYRYPPEDESPPPSREAADGDRSWRAS
ncbi:HEPN domain-containing protein [Azospirillum sp. SYSU D00513]|uniref:HEPN domain-containing protein n=1 Tax=Azospirillum sp. SYSU D00513 TaxID=2812561 RepID=UPI001A96370E|nr:HEPN domain-containing protein [Azospirillum sp. SYSU D00513]